jgi:hypothetical protein
MPDHIVSKGLHHHQVAALDQTGDGSITFLRRHTRESGTKLVQVDVVLMTTFDHPQFLGVEVLARRPIRTAKDLTHHVQGG